MTVKIELDTYEAENLLKALDAITDNRRISSLNTGDWVRQVWYKVVTAKKMYINSPEAEYDDFGLR